MTVAIGRESVVLVGFSNTLLLPLADLLPPDSVIVLEEPSIAAKRDVGKLAERFPAVSRVIESEYQTPDGLDALAAGEGGLAGVRAVVPGVEYAVAAAAELAQRLGLPGAGADAGRVFRDKARQRRVAAEAGLANPEFALVESAAQAAEFVRRAGGRCVVKPTARQASLGVRFVSTPEQALAAFAHAADVHEATLEPDRGIASGVLVERAIEGEEFSVEALMARGTVLFANVTAKRLVPGPCPVELGHRVPGLPAADPRTGRLIEATARLAQAAGFRDGALHAEWIVAEDKPVLVECAARLPGDEIGTLISAAYDFPLAHAYLRVLLGEPPRLPSAAAHGAAIRFLTAPPGMVRAVSGIEAAEQVPGVRTVKVTANPGDLVRPVASSWDRIGYVLARRATPEDAEEAAVRAAGLVEVAIEPAPAGAA
jgi:biotin carboxylase